MRRAVKLTLDFATAKKRSTLDALVRRYRAAVNFFIRLLWSDDGRFDYKTAARLTTTQLSARYKCQALKQAEEVVRGTKASAKALKTTASRPHYTGPATLDAKFVTIEKGKGSFDLVLKISTLKSGKRVTIPTKATAVLRKWLSYPGAELVQGCSLSEQKLVLWVKTPNCDPNEAGPAVGIDIGVNKLIATSDGEFYGTEFKAIRNKINRRKRGSKGRRRAYAERDNYINQVLNRLPWASYSVMGVEALSDMKRGKQKGRGKTFRKALSPWTYRQVLTRIEHKAQENRVLLVTVDPAYTSRTCPHCRAVSKASRKGENFRCVACDWQGDADFVGATEVLVRTLRTVGRVESPTLKTA